MQDTKPVNMTFQMKGSDYNRFENFLTYVKEYPNTAEEKLCNHCCKQVALEFKEFFRSRHTKAEYVDWNETCWQSRKPKPLTKQERIDQLLRELQVLLKEKEE